MFHQKDKKLLDSFRNKKLDRNFNEKCWKSVIHVKHGRGWGKNQQRDCLGQEQFISKISRFSLQFLFFFRSFRKFPPHLLSPFDTRRVLSVGFMCVGRFWFCVFSVFFFNLHHNGQLLDFAIAEREIFDLSTGQRRCNPLFIKNNQNKKTKTKTLAPCFCFRFQKWS